MAHGKLWPAHPKPFPDELLSSWIVRIAEANSIKLQTLSRLLFGDQRTPWNRDIDHSAPDWLLDAICRNTGVGYRQARATTLAIYAGRIYPRNTMAVQFRWVLPILGYGTKRRGFCMQFCPACLADDARPYFRKQWRLAFYTYCPIHQIALHDACPACGAPICHYRRDFGLDLPQAPDMAHCTSCGFNLREAVRRTPDFANEEIRVEFDRMLLSVVNRGQIDFETEYGFFAVLHQLCRVMCMQQNNWRLLRFVNNQIGQEDDWLPGNSHTLEHLRLADRHRLVSLALWLMIDLEPRLTLAWRQRAVRYNSLLKEFSDTPRWYDNVVGKFSDWRKDKVLSSSQIP
jgi:hypothetical protein